MNIWYTNSPFGTLCLEEEGGALVGVNFLPEGVPELEPLPRKVCQTPLLAEAEEQLGEYFAGVRREFDLPLAPRGTAFQQAVWEQLLAIPYGETRSYGQLAAALGRPGASRAVGVDIDEVAVRVATENAQQNGVAGRAAFLAGDLTQKVEGTYQVVTAIEDTFSVILMICPAGRPQARPIRWELSKADYAALPPGQLVYVPPEALHPLRGPEDGPAR